MSGLFEQSRSIASLNCLKTAEVPVHKIVDLALVLVRTNAENRNIAITVSLESSDAKVRVNQFVLARVLLNLLRNAVEAVEPKTGKVSLSAKAMDGYIEFAIQDDGPGIPPRYMQRIFDARFSTKKTGEGLGLYICKHLVESMAGTLSVRNEPGFGCCFSVRIPRPS